MLRDCVALSAMTAKNGVIAKQSRGRAVLSGWLDAVGVTVTVYGLEKAGEGPGHLRQPALRRTGAITSSTRRSSSVAREQWHSAYLGLLVNRGAPNSISVAGRSSII